LDCRRHGAFSYSPIPFDRVWEIPNGQFVKRYRLPNFVQQEQASATYKDGILTISFPKREEAKARRIEINV